MGLLTSVYTDKSGMDTTNGGVTSKVSGVVIVNAEGPFEPDEDKPAVRVKTVSPTGTPYTKAVPVNPDSEGKVGPSFGGNFIFSSDSRFPSDQPIPVHDRFDTQEEYNHLSR